MVVTMMMMVERDAAVTPDSTSYMVAAVWLMVVIGSRRRSGDCWWVLALFLFCRGGHSPHVWKAPRDFRRYRGRDCEKEWFVEGIKN